VGVEVGNFGKFGHFTSGSAILAACAINWLRKVERPLRMYEL